MEIILSSRKLQLATGLDSTTWLYFASLYWPYRRILVVFWLRNDEETVDMAKNDSQNRATLFEAEPRVSLGHIDMGRRELSDR